MDYPKASLTADCVVVDGSGAVLLIRRARPPFKGRLALPGGFVDPGETVEAAAARELAEETGLVARSLELVGVFSRPGRDPRGWVVSVAFRVEDWSGELRAGDDASGASFEPVSRSTRIAFDHAEILKQAGVLL